jgi:UDP-N-acetylmuramyl pentapeptide phosphotransferase/UDP-N-acetylglucosamine-1-phosphate transferase
MVLLGQGRSNVVTVAVISATMPVVGIATEVLLDGRKLTWALALGVLLSLGGGVMALGGGSDGWGTGLGLGALLCFGSVVLFTLGSRMTVTSFPALSPLGRTTVTLSGAALTTSVAAGVHAMLGGTAPDWNALGLKELGALAVFAIGGLPHAFNIIDGYNGLAGAVAILSCLAISHVALQLGDRDLAGMLVCLAGATAGFLVWNYPKGKIFAGDCGAYVWGMVIGVACVVIVQRHSAVSPWFPVMVLIYPLCETFFSIYRKLARGQSPGTADALHFHQLVFRRIVRPVLFGGDQARELLARNNKTAPYLWMFSAVSLVPAVLFWRNTVVLMVFSVLFAVAYVSAYLAIVRFKVPRWLRF